MDDTSSVKQVVWGGARRAVARVRSDRRLAIAVAIVALVLAGAAVGAARSGEESGDVAGRVAGLELSQTDEGAAAAGAGGGSGAAHDLDARQEGMAAGGGDAFASAPALDDAVAGQAEGTEGPGLVQTGDAIVRTADLRIEVGDGKLRAAFERVLRIASSHGGFVVQSSQSNPGDRGDTAEGGQATIVLRVPADRFDDARAELARMGDVVHQQVAGEDVSDQLVDIGARLRNLRAQEEALLALMGRAEAVGEVLQIQNQVFAVRDQIERLDAQRAGLEDRVRLATITVDVFEPGSESVVFHEDTDEGLGDAVDDAIDGAESVVAGTIVVVGTLLPVAALLLVAWLVWRVVRPRRRSSGSVDPAATTGQAAG